MEYFKGINALSIFLFFTSQLSSTHATFNLKLRRNAIECFEVYVPGPSRSLISANYELIGDYTPETPKTLYTSFQQIDSTDPEATTKEENPLQPRSVLTQVGTGTFQLCFRSKKANKETEIGFNIHVEDLKTRSNRLKNSGAAATDTYNPDVYRHINISKEKNQKEKSDQPEKENADNSIDMAKERIMELSARIFQQMSQLEDRRIFVKHQAGLARDMIEDTFTRVIRWNILETFVVLGMAVGQVIYLKNRFNNQKRYF